MALVAAWPAAAQTFETSPTAADAAKIFRKVCVNNAAHLAQAEGVLLSMDFIHQPESEIYYHPTHDLSFAVRSVEGGDDWYCSMVWSSVDPLPVNQSAISALAADAEPVTFSDSTLMRTRVFGQY